MWKGFTERESFVVPGGMKSCSRTRCDRLAGSISKHGDSHLGRRTVLYLATVGGGTSPRTLKLFWLMTCACAGRSLPWVVAVARSNAVAPERRGARDVRRAWTMVMNLMMNRYVMEQ